MSSLTSTDRRCECGGGHCWVHGVVVLPNGNILVRTNEPYLRVLSPDGDEVGPTVEAPWLPVPSSPGPLPWVGPQGRLYYLAGDRTGSEAWLYATCQGLEVRWRFRTCHGGNVVVLSDGTLWYGSYHLSVHGGILERAPSPRDEPGRVSALAAVGPSTSWFGSSRAPERPGEEPWYWYIAVRGAERFELAGYTRQFVGMAFDLEGGLLVHELPLDDPEDPGIVYRWLDGERLWERPIADLGWWPPAEPVEGGFLAYGRFRVDPSVDEWYRHLGRLDLDGNELWRLRVDDVPEPYGAPDFRSLQTYGTNLPMRPDGVAYVDILGGIAAVQTDALPVDGKCFHDHSGCNPRGNGFVHLAAP